ncbi:HipA family kinase [Pantoea sp. ME81]|uniref:HipA family kinase n=1 Tax=Pantoea sp. ME81 TaxID=2743935 RepID=UPI0021051D46|nr:HipA family kinase [Pantoea sp. ME81]
MDSPKISVVEFIRRIKEGSTKPILCRCDDGKKYIVKSMPLMPPKHLLAEFISACLASDLGLPLPDFNVVYIPEELLEFSPELKDEIKSGYAFATLYIENAVSLTFAQSRNERVIPVDEQKRIYLFDRWVMNGDRSLTAKGGNVNMLYDVQHDRYYLIDHNLAFDQNADAGDFDYHVYSHKSREWAFDMVDRVVQKEKLLNAYCRMPHFWEDVPEDWCVDQDFINSIETTLTRAETDEFWSSII